MIKGIWCCVVAVACIGSGGCASGKVVLTVGRPVDGADMTATIQRMIDSAATYQGRKPVEIRLQPGVYNISRQNATCRYQHITNTTSVSENPDPVKHYGLYLHHMSDVTIDGRGATLLTHGEMTSMAVDSCSRIQLKNLTIDAADPSVPEMTVLARNDSTLVCRLAKTTRCHIAPDSRLSWVGHGWEFSGGIAQLYDGKHTWRCQSPMERYVNASIDGDVVTLCYRTGEAPECEPGQVYQMRHSYRTEVATFINRSSDISLHNVTYHFLGNFGIVGQFSHNVTLDRVICAPDPASDRTCAGFADFMQMSGCSGMVRIKDCDFSGAHDDPINVHGTHLKVTGYDGAWMTVRFMHGQTFGFVPFAVGDEVAAVNACTLRAVASAVVKNVQPIDDYNYRIMLDSDISGALQGLDEVVVENVTATPEVEITGCRFTLTPTRGVLLTTSRKALIADNTFVNIPMSAILIADDGRSWYESGPVRDVTIIRNRFIDCASPVISISPENSEYDGPVHSGIRIISNEFIFSDKDSEPVIVSAKATDGLIVKKNKVNCRYSPILLKDCTDSDVE